MIKDEELKKVFGGAISGTLINSIVRAYEFVLELGRSLGTALKRKQTNRQCF